MQTVTSKHPQATELESVRVGVSDNLDPSLAVADLFAALDAQSAACVIFFCSTQYDLHALGKALQQTFVNTPVVGCTTAGEISPQGIRANPICAIALAAKDFSAEIVSLEDLAFAEEATVTRAITDATERLRTAAVAPIAEQTFAFSLLDGLSIREEIMLPVMHAALGGIPLLGGSAGDAMDFRGTYVYANGEFRENAAVLALINTRCPFEILSSHHFAPTQEKLVVTRADPEKRVVLELNAEPAAPEYCRVMGLSLDDLETATFACHPLGVQLGEHLFARSIRQVNDDLSLTFFCAIDTGIILTQLEDTGLLEHFKSQMKDAIENIGEPLVVLACDCIHRFHEADSTKQLDALAELYKRFNVVGFNTYGEQCEGLHVNHSFTGIAIGRASD